MTSQPSSPAKLEALLRDACQRAFRLGSSFADHLRLYRSIIALAREVRLSIGAQAPRTDSQTLPALMAAVCDHACDLGLDPALALPDAILLQRLATGLSRAARLAQGAGQAKNLIHRENRPKRDRTKPEPAPIAEGPGYREDTLADKEPLHREPMPTDTPPDDHLSAWRKDHTTERDQRAHEKLRTVLNERIFEPARAEGRRLRAEKAATRPASPASASAPPSGAGSPPPDDGFDPASARPLVPLAAE